MDPRLQQAVDKYERDLTDGQRLNFLNIFEQVFKFRPLLKEVVQDDNKFEFAGEVWRVSMGGLYVRREEHVGPMWYYIPSPRVYAELAAGQTPSPGEIL